MGHDARLSPNRAASCSWIASISCASGWKPAPTTRWGRERALWASSAPARPTSTWPRRSRTRASSSSGVTWPLPAAALRDFADSVEAVYVVEEGSEYLKDAVRACGVPVSETPCPAAGRRAVAGARARALRPEQPPHAPAATDLPGRPPALCPDAPIASCSRSSRGCGPS